MRSLFLALLVTWLSAVPALADTCKYIDKDGRVIYSNAPVKNARKLTCFQEPALPPPEPPKARPAEPSTGETGQKRIEPAVQRKRDDDRRKILEEELAREQKALEEAKKVLADQQAQRAGEERNYARVQERVKPFQDAVMMHEKNISSIQQELGNLQ
jgi:hypothetical protein